MGRAGEVWPKSQVEFFSKASSVTSCDNVFITIKPKVLEASNRANILQVSFFAEKMYAAAVKVAFRGLSHTASRRLGMVSLFSSNFCILPSTRPGVQEASVVRAGEGAGGQSETHTPAPVCAWAGFQ